MALSAQFSAAVRKGIRVALLRWFDRHRRDLPWRRTRKPYRIWVAEIMLQQTRVAVVVERYGEFLRRYPSVQALAAAPLADVLAAWSGLGYYRRARSLHQAARLIVSTRNGRLPETAAEWRELPGIGRYTAAAIASIASGERCAVLDGNVERVLRRMFAPSNGSLSALWNVAEQLLSRARPGDFNQALMELGATICLPQRPRCAECPVHIWCATGGESSHPVAPKPGATRVGHPVARVGDPVGRPPARRKSEVAYGLALRGNRVYLVRRPAAASLMPEMWELPEVQADPASLPLFTLRHAITVTDYRVQVYAACAPLVGGRWIPREQATGLPLTGLARKILRRAEII